MLFCGVAWCMMLCCGCGVLCCCWCVVCYDVFVLFAMLCLRVLCCDGLCGVIGVPCCDVLFCLRLR